MNKVTLVLLLLPMFCFSQKTFAPVGSSWKYEKHTLDPCKDHFFEIKSEKELLIAGKDCSVLYGYNSIDGSPFYKATDSLVIWEDGQQIYFEQEGAFYLLYDFGLEANDTMQVYFPTKRGVFSHPETLDDEYPRREDYLIEVVDEVVLGLDTLRRLWTIPIGDSYYLGAVIERVGSDSEHMIGALLCVADGCGCYMICKEDDEISYPADRQCDFVTSSDEVKEVPLSIYPNPTLGPIFLDIEEGLDVRVEIHDISGQIFSKSLDLSRKMIDLSTYEPGLYIAKIYLGPDLAAVEKIVKL